MPYKTNFLSIIGLFLYFIVSISYANNTCIKAFEKTEYGAISFPCLQVAGKIKLIGTTVQGNTKIAGILEAESAKLNTLAIAGSAIMHKTMIAGITHIAGSLQAYQTQFKSVLIISSDSVKLFNSTSQDIKMSASNRQQTIYLNDQSIVNGNIVFINNKGVVICENSKIKGRVIGGIVKGC